MTRVLSIALAAFLLAACGGGGGGGASSPTPPASRPPPPAVTATITSSSPSVSYGELVTLTYFAANAASCELTSNVPGATNPLSVSLSSSTQLRIYGAATFTYSCTGTTPGTSARSEVTVPLSTPALTYSVSHGGVNDVAWDATRGILYLALGAASRIAPNSVAAFDPVTSTVLGTAFAGSEPNTISLNEDGTKLYVGFRTSSTVSRFSVPALTRDFTVPLPLHSAGQYAGYPDFSIDIAAAPGASEKFAVSLHAPQLAQSHGKLMVFDGTTVLPTALSGTTPPEIYEQGSMLAWADPDSLIAIYDFGAAAEIARYETQTGRVVNRGRIELSNATAGGIVHDAGRVYTNCGHVVDASSLQLLPTYARTCGEISSFTNAQVLPDSPNNQTFFVERREDREDSSYSYVIAVYRQDTRELLHKARIPILENQLFGKITNLQRIGPDGLAMTTSGGDLLIVSGPFVAPTGASAMAGTLPSAPPMPVRDVSFDVLLSRALDLAWDAGRQRLYAAVAADAPEHAGQIAVFQFPNPANPSFVSRPYAVSEIDATGDGQFLYAIGTDSFAFERLRLPDFVSERQVALPGTPHEIHAAPGRPLTVVVSGSIFDDATLRGATSGGQMRWGATADRLFAFSSEDSGFRLTSFDMSGGAVTPLWYYDHIFSSVHLLPFYSGYTQAGGLLYADTGVVFDPETNIVNGIFAIGPTSGYGVLTAPFDTPFATAAWGPIAIDEPDHRAYVLGCVGTVNQDLCTSFLQVYDTRTYAPLANSQLGIGGRARQLLRVGQHGLVAITYDRRAIYIADPASTDP